MNKIGEKTSNSTNDKNNRRDFLKRIYKYAIGLSAFGAASVFGFRKNGEIRLGEMRDFEIGHSEAHGACGSAYDCSGGGGECGSAYDCSGGGGQCGSAYNCSGGGGQCGSAYDCSGQ